MVLSWDAPLFDLIGGIVESNSSDSNGSEMHTTGRTSWGMPVEEHFI